MSELAGRIDPETDSVDEDLVGRLADLSASLEGTLFAEEARVAMEGLRAIARGTVEITGHGEPVEP